MGVGRFNRVDPWAGNELSPITLNKYLYANGNPLAYVDPDGRASYLSDWEAYTDDTVDRYRQDIDRAAAEGAAARAFALGVGKGFASLGNLVVGGLNTTSNLLARSLYDGSTYEQAQRELESDIFAMSQAIEAAHTVAAVVQEDPSGAVVAVHGAAVGFTADLMARDPRAMAGLGEFTGQLVVPGAGAKSLKLTGEALDVARAAMRMGDGFLDVGMDDLDAAYGAVARGVDVRHSREIEVPFGQGVGNQGYAYENALAAGMAAENRLPPNFKTFDFLDRGSGLAISAKTLDTTTPSRLNNPQRVYSSLRDSINAAADFDRYRLGPTRLTSADIDLREVRVAVPLETTMDQWTEVMRAIRYAEQQGVRLVPEVVTNSSR